MTDRAQDVRLLLRALLLTVPDPRTWTGSVAAGAQPGEIAVKRVPCQACQGTGQRRTRGIEQVCTEYGCKDGWRRVDPQTLKRTMASDPTETGEFTAEQRSTWEAVTDAQIERGAAIIRQREGTEAAGDTLTGAVDRRDRLDKHGSFAELRAALEWLRDKDVDAHRLVDHHLVHGWPAMSGGQVEKVLDIACELLALRMPVPIRVPGFLRSSNEWRAKTSLHRGRTAAHAAQRAERDAEIVARAAQGETVVDLAVRYALTERQVRRILTHRANGEAA